MAKKVLLRLDDYLHAAVCRLAAAEDRSAAATYRRIIRAAVLPEDNSWGPAGPAVPAAPAAEPPIDDDL